MASNGRPAPQTEPASRVQLLVIGVIALLSVVGAMAVGYVMLGSAQTDVEARVPLPTATGEPLFARADGIPLWVVRRDGGVVDVFWARAPSGGGSIDWVATTHDRWDQADGMPAGEGFFVDTRTGARWTSEGLLGWGPTFRGLDRFGYEIEAAEVIVDLDLVLRGLCDPGVDTREKCSTPGNPVWQQGPTESG